MSIQLEYRVSEQQEQKHVRPEGIGMAVDISATQMRSGKNVEVLDNQKSSAYSTFMSNYACWNAVNALSSESNVRNEYFEKIVEMGIDAVPLIYAELKKKPTDLVYALDAIFGYPIKSDTFVPLKTSCELWISILQKTGRFS